MKSQSLMALAVLTSFGFSSVVQAADAVPDAVAAAVKDVEARRA
jgi:hypothetical protein